MELLNKNGNVLMGYRREFKRHYADSVDEALKDAVYTLYKEGQISEKLFRMIFDENIEDGDVYSYLVSKREFTKSSMELNSEFDQVRERVNTYLIKIGFTKNVCTKNSINTNRIYVIKQYDIPKDLLLRYFGLTPTEIIPLMKRKGFMDKFCVLRLSQAFKEIYGSLKVPEHLDHGYSLIYYNKSIQGFSIDYKYMVNINYIMDEERMMDVMDRIKDLDAIVEKQFEQKMSYSYFKNAMSDLTSKELQAEIEGIVVPIRTGKRSKDIRKPELIVDEVMEAESAPIKDAEQKPPPPTNKRTDEKTSTEKPPVADNAQKGDDGVKSLPILELTPPSNTADKEQPSVSIQKEKPADPKVPNRQSDNRPAEQNGKKSEYNRPVNGTQQSQQRSETSKPEKTVSDPKPQNSSIPSSKEQPPQQPQHAQGQRRLPDLTNKPQPAQNKQHPQQQNRYDRKDQRRPVDYRSQNGQKPECKPDIQPEKKAVIVIDEDDAISPVTTPKETKPEQTAQQTTEDKAQQPSGEHGSKKIPIDILKEDNDLI